MIDLGVLLRVPCVEVEMGFDVSPDGEHVAFSWNPEGRWDIYEISLRGSPGSRTGRGSPGSCVVVPVPARETGRGKTDPYPVSRGPGGKFHPRYSPDGKSLAFSVDFDGSEAFHLFVHDFGTGELRDLTPDLNWTLHSFFSWSPDGKHIAFIADQSGQFNVYVIPAEGGDARLVLDAGYPAWKVRWSPDGLWLAVTVEAGGIDYGTFIVPAKEDGAACRIADESGPIDAGQTCWSPDSTRLAFSSDVHGYNISGSTSWPHTASSG
ncbi:MAG: hypothetical protein D4R46_01705 [Chloroflexi bacterium]|nr:MAG: hypothetical protein D4R46_01705 [Chloroflexota bacterium]